MFKRIVAAGFIVAAISAGSAAQAVQYIFTVTGSYSSVFAIDKLTSPVSFTSTTSTFDPVGGIFDGNDGVAAITFGADPEAAMLTIDDGSSSPVSFFGDPVFVNTTARPRFAEGNYALTTSLGAALLNIREADGSPDPVPIPGGGEGSTVPEPATWALMIGGFAMTGAMQRRRSRQTVTA